MKYAICLLVLLTPKIAVTQPNDNKKIVLKRPIVKTVPTKKTSTSSKSVDKTTQVRQAEVVDFKTTKLQYDLAALKEAIKAVCSKGKQDGQAATEE